MYCFTSRLLSMSATVTPHDDACHRSRSRSPGRLPTSEGPDEPDPNKAQPIHRRPAGQGPLMVFDPAEHTALRRRDSRPLVGVACGTLPSNPQQNSQLGAPFVYTAGQLAITQCAGTLSAAGRDRISTMSSRDTVAEDLSGRGYFLTGGFAHGFDFVAYEGDPVRHHGSHFVVVTDPRRSISPLELVRWHRLAASAHKTVIIASVDDTKDDG